MDERIQMRLEEFLSHFPGYRWKIFPDQRVKDKISTPNVNRSFEEALILNTQTPS